MGWLLLPLLASVVVATGQRTSHVSIKHGGANFHLNTPQESAFNGKIPLSNHISTPAVYIPQANDPSSPVSYASSATISIIPEDVSYPSTKLHPLQTKHSYGKPDPVNFNAIPACSNNSTKTWCLEDFEYPTYEIKSVVEKHLKKVLQLYADISELNTANSVAGGPQTLDEETYLCPSEISYVRPLRAVNVAGYWRLVVNGIRVHYEELTQTVRLEECLSYNQPCPLLPQCYQSKCLQKSVYHRFLVYDPKDLYFPFAIENFKLPASCACFLEEFNF